MKYRTHTQATVSNLLDWRCVSQSPVPVGAPKKETKERKISLDVVLRINARRRKRRNETPKQLLIKHRRCGRDFSPQSCVIDFYLYEYSQVFPFMQINNCHVEEEEQMLYQKQSTAILQLFCWNVILQEKGNWSQIDQVREKMMCVSYSQPAGLSGGQPNGFCLVWAMTSSFLLVTWTSSYPSCLFSAMSSRACIHCTFWPWKHFICQYQGLHFIKCTTWSPQDLEVAQTLCFLMRPNVSTLCRSSYTTDVIHHIKCSVPAKYCGLAGAYEFGGLLFVSHGSCSSWWAGHLQNVDGSIQQLIQIQNLKISKKFPILCTQYQRVQGGFIFQAQRDADNVLTSCTEKGVWIFVLHWTWHLHGPTCGTSHWTSEAG